MREVATISFQDVENEDEAVALVRAGENAVGLALSLKTDGDIEICLSADDADALISALRRAVINARSFKAGPQT
jgi:hypothetical protein